VNWAVDVEALDTLEAALRAERSALIGNDTDALARANAAKLEALQQLQTAPADSVAQERLAALAEFNRANGALLVRRQREVTWALRQLGRSETVPAYGADGQLGRAAHKRALGVG